VTTVNPPPTHVPWREVLTSPLFWFVIACGIAFGTVLNIRPTVFPILRGSFDTTYEQLGRIQLVFFAVGIVFSLSGGWLVGKIGLRRAAVLTLWLNALGTWFFTSGSTLAFVFVGACLLGIGKVGIVVACAAILVRSFTGKCQSSYSTVWPRP